MEAADRDRIAEREKASWTLRRLRCCTAAGCLASGAKTIVDTLAQGIAERKAEKAIQVEPVGCLKLCGRGPLVQADPSGLTFAAVTPDKIDHILAVALDEQPVGPQIEVIEPNHPFLSRQLPVVLETSGLANPLRLETSLAHGAYATLAQILRELQPSDVVDAVTQSRLRGRGGAGYPTGLKWNTVAKAQAEQKFVVCNADSGDPGAYKDRAILESDPHRLFEGMAIAGYAVGATQGFIYIRGEYFLAIERLQAALLQARKAGLLGKNIFNSGFDFTLELRIGAGAFVCGEETALMASIMGQRGTPRPRPPYPAESGLWGYPTLINNVETLATIPTLLRRGPEWYASLGTVKSGGTKVFSLSGQVRFTGLIEVPIGTPMRVIIEEMAGGALPGHRIKAVQTGGPSGGCLPAELLDTPVDYEPLLELGSMMGSGGMVVMDDRTDMVEVARYFMDFCRDESCGKCIPCRAGTVQMHGLLSRIRDGKADRFALALLEDLADMVKHTSLCGLGQSAPNPVLSTLRHFRPEYEAKLRKE